MSWSDRILEILSDGTRSPAGDSWELSYRSHSTGVTRYAASRVHQNVESDSINVRARVTVGKRIGSANTSDMRPEGVRAVLRKAYQIARSSPEDPTFDNFSPSAEDRPSGEALFSRVTDELTAADRAERVNIILKRLDGDSLGAAGLVSTRTDRAAVLNSRGLSDAFRGTTGCIRVFALGADSASGYAGSVARDFTTLDAAAVASTAARKAVRGRGPITIEPGDYDVILEPTAVSEIIEWMSMGSFGARSFENSSSLLAGRIGEQVTGKNVTIRTTDASVGGNAPAELFDAEGVIRRPIDIIKSGVAKGVVHDMRSAHRASVEGVATTSTGHASADAMQSSPHAKHLEMLPGDSSFGQLVSKVKRGLWITRFHYVNGLLDTRDARMTGMTRDGTFLIEKGRITRGVTNMRFTDSLLEAFSRIDGVTSDRRVVPTWWAEGGAHVVPGVLIRNLHFSSS